jgi:hypothetical protein
MQTPDTDEIRLHRLLSCRTCGIRDDPERAILEITTSSGTVHLQMHVSDLATLGRRMILDAQLLAPPADLSTRIDQAGGY